MNTVDAIKKIYSKPKNERLEFIVNKFDVSETYAMDLILVLENFEKILKNNEE